MFNIVFIVLIKIYIWLFQHWFAFPQFFFKKYHLIIVILYRFVKFTKTLILIYLKLGDGFIFFCCDILYIIIHTLHISEYLSKIIKVTLVIYFFGLCPSKAMWKLKTIAGFLFISCIGCWCYFLNSFWRTL